MCLSVSAAFLCGTLIVAVPTNDGWVVAADSRTTNSEKTEHCDDAYKLMQVGDSAIVALTGLRAVADRDNDVDPCNHGVVFLDFLAEFKSFLDTTTDMQAPSLFSDLSPILDSKIQKLPAEDKEKMHKELVGKSLGALIIFGYDRKTRIPWLRWGDRILADDLKLILIASGAEHRNNSKFWRFGDHNSISDDALVSLLRFKFKEPNTFDFITKPKKVSDTTKDEAVSAMIDYIGAVGTIDAGVGGPIDIVLINDAVHHIQWKH